MTAPLERELVRQMIDRGLIERRPLRAGRRSLSAFRYVPARVSNVGLRQELVALAHRHKPYGLEITHLKLRQAGMLVS